jgi:hypothetical protein
MIKYLFQRSPNAPLECTSHCEFNFVLSTMTLRSVSYIKSIVGSAMSWSLHCTLIATCTGGERPTTVASTTRPYAPEAMRPSTRNCHSPSLRMGLIGPMRGPRGEEGKVGRGGAGRRGIVGRYVQELGGAGASWAGSQGSLLSCSCMSGTINVSAAETKGRMGCGAEEGGALAGRFI